MLTFLRRIRISLIESGSAQKYLLYAIGEILLVMIGILLALQVNNWNQDRLDRKREILLLSEINKEFKYNKKEIRTTINAYNHVKRFCTYMQESFPIEDNKVNRDTISRYLRVFRSLVTSDLSMGSISTLINTSSFDIISNNELRSLLIQWENLVTDLFARETQAINYTRQNIIPYLAKRIPQPYIKGIYDERVDLSFMSTIEFENLINDRLHDSKTLLQVVEGERSKITQALERIMNYSLCEPYFI